MERDASGGQHLHVVQHGAGIPVLAVHGWTPDHRLMTGCLEPVFSRRPGYRRLYPDLPGMGRTVAAPATRSSDDVLAALLDLVDERIGGEPFLVVGESYGGYLARAVVRERADQARGMALICPIGTAVEPVARRVPRHTVIHADPGVAASVAADPDFAEIAVVHTADTLRRFEADIAPGLAVADETAMARIRRRWTLSDPPEAGSPFERPTLIITGRQDSSVGYEDQFALLSHYPRASFAVLDAAGHNAQFEQPVLFEALMSEWLDRVAAA